MPASPSTAHDHLEPALRFLRRMARGWWIGLLVLAVGLAGTAAFAVFRPKQYRSEAVVYYREGLQWTTSEGQSTRRVGQRLKDTLLARRRLAPVIEDLGLYPGLVKKGRMAEAVEEMLAATAFRISDGDIFVISFTGDTPKQAQAVTARLTEVLIEENTRLRAGQAEVAQAFLDAEKKRNEEDLAAREAAQLRFLSRHPEFAHEQQGTVGVALRARSRGEARPEAEADTALAALKREERRLRRQLATPGQIPRPPLDPELVAARTESETRLRNAQRELAERAARFTEQHPEYRSAQGRLKEAEDAHRRAVANIEAAERAVTPAALEARLAQVQQEIAASATRNPKAKAEDPGSSEAAQRVVAVEAEWARLSRDVAEARERLQQLDSRQFMASMTLSTLVSGQASQIVVIDPAYLPARPVGMRNQRLALMGLAVSLVLALGAMALRVMADDHVRDRVDAEALSIAPVLAEVGTLPALTAAAGPTRKALPAPPPPPEPPVDAGAPALGAGDADGGGSVPEPGGALVPSPASAAVITIRDAARDGTTAGGAPEGGDGPRGPRARVRVSRAPVPGAADPRLTVLSAPDSPAAAGFRVLRHRLRAEEAGTVLLVTSPAGAEGKSVCAVNLALALGEGGQARVLLVEANFRSPSIAAMLGHPPPVGLQEQLERYRSTQSRQWEVVETASPWLHVAPASPGRDGASLLDGPALGAFLEDMRAAGYDHVVVDGPPVLGSADANLIEESVDGILVVLRAGLSRKRQFRKAVEQVGDGKLLGVVLMGA